MSESDELRNFAKSYIWAFVFFVVIPSILSFNMFENAWENGRWGELGGNAFLIITMSIYYMPPALIVGEPYFTGGMGIFPSGFGGLLIGAGFYALASLFIAIAIQALREAFKKNKS